MQELLARQLRDGAAGLVARTGVSAQRLCRPSRIAALAQTTKAHGKLVAAHIRSYEDGLNASIDEFLDLLKTPRAPGLLSHLQSAGRPNWGKIPRALEQLEAARLAGVDVSFDMYPYLAGSSYILQLLPPEMLEGGLPSLMAKLADPQTRERCVRRWRKQTLIRRRHIQGRADRLGQYSHFRHQQSRAQILRRANRCRPPPPSKASRRSN